MSFIGFNAAASALNAFQLAAEATSSNITNANTPGASRQVVDLNQTTPIRGLPGFSTRTGPGSLGTGVTVRAIKRIHQDSFDSLFRGASSSQNFYGVQEEQLTTFQTSLAISGGGINSAFTAFQNAIVQLGSQPANPATRASVLAQAQALATALNTASAQVVAQKAQLFDQASTVVTKVNGMLDDIASLNNQIRTAKAVGDNPNTQLDQRDRLIDQLSELLQTQTSLQPNGSALVTVGGRALVNDTIAYHLAPPVVGTASNGVPTFKIGFTSDPNPTNPSAVNLGSGQLAAYADLYTNKLTGYATQLDNFANGLATEFNRVAQSAYDQNGVPGTALFTSSVGGQSVNAGSIAVGLNDLAQVTAALASTAAGKLVVPLNSANNSLDTSANLAGNTSLANPPATLTGTLTVNVDGVNRSFAYDMTAGSGTDSTMAKLVSHFNSGHYGVTASFDVSGQRIVFARDPANEDLFQRGQPGYVAGPAFTLTDNNNTIPGTTPPANFLLGVLGAAAIHGVAQNASNALGTNDNAAANAFAALFQSSVGVPGIQTTSGAIATGTQTVAPAGGLGNIGVGQSLTIDAGTASQENVTVTAINATTGTFTATFTKSHSALPNPTTIAAAQTQSLGQYFGNFVMHVGLDARTAITGNATQTTLTKNVEKVRQSIDGINLDEETQNLIKFQNAYQAAAKTMSILDSLLGTVISSLGGR